jgi:hypothetical protein
MELREEIQELRRMGSLPSIETAMGPGGLERIEPYERLLGSIQKPVTDEEARVLAGLFGPDDCFGLAWALLSLIESAPGWPLWDCLTDTSNEWVQLLVQRLKNAGFTPQKL